jgi:hypothetical protein
MKPPKIGITGVRGIVGETFTPEVAVGSAQADTAAPFRLSFHKKENNLLRLTDPNNVWPICGQNSQHLTATRRERM